MAMGRLVIFKITESPWNRFPKTSALEASSDSLTHLSEEALDLATSEGCHKADVQEGNLVPCGSRSRVDFE